MKRKIAFLLTIIMMVTIIGIHAQASSAPVGSVQWCEENYGSDWEHTVLGIPTPTPTTTPIPVITTSPLPEGYEDENYDDDPYIQAQKQALMEWLEMVKPETTEDNTQPVASTPVVTNKHYEDVPSNAWYAEAVNAMTEGGLLKGYDDGMFHPGDIVTQGQFATILCRLMGLPETMSQFEQPDFHWDTSDQWFGNRTVTVVHWSQGSIMNLSMKGMYLIPQGAETADNPVWRADAINMMYEVAGYTKYKPNGERYFDWTSGTKTIVTPTEKVWTEDNIPDWKAISYDTMARTREHDDGSPHDIKYAGHMWYKGYIRDAYNLGFTKGIDDAGTCNPEGELTRAELAQMLYNAGWVEYGCATKH